MLEKCAKASITTAWGIHGRLSPLRGSADLPDQAIRLSHDLPRQLLPEPRPGTPQPLHETPAPGLHLRQEEHSPRHVDPILLRQQRRELLHTILHRPGPRSIHSPQCQHFLLLSGPMAPTPLTVCCLQPTSARRCIYCTPMQCTAS